MSGSLSLQQAVFDALVAALSVSVYDHVPDDAAFPYVVVGEDTLNMWDTKSINGFDAMVTLHTWSRYRGRKECKQIQGNIYDALHDAPLAITGYNHVYTYLDNEDSFLDEDGLTRHGVSRYRVVFAKE